MRHAHNTALVRPPVRIYMIGMRQTILAETHSETHCAVKTSTFGLRFDIPQKEVLWSRLGGKYRVFSLLRASNGRFAQ